MSKEIVSQGESFEVIVDDRTYGGTNNVVALRVDGTTGKLTTGGTTTPGVYGAAAGSGYSGGSTVLSGVSFVSGVHVGLSAAGSIALAGAAVGDIVVMATNLTTPANAATLFESVITVAGHIQQSSSTDLSASTFTFLLVHQ